MNFLFSKKNCFFFCFFLMKISQSLLVIKDGSKFWSSQMWQHFLTQTKQFDRECTSNQRTIHFIFLWKKWKTAKNGLSKWLCYVKINRIFNFDHQSLIYFPLNYTNMQCLCPSMHFGLLSSNNNLLISLHPHFRTSRGLFRKLSPRNKFRIFIFIIYMATQLTKYTPKLD